MIIINWFRSMIKYFHRQNRKWLSKLSRDYRVYLLAYPDRSIQLDSGFTTHAEPEQHEIRAVFVPYASSGIGRIFGERLMREARGEYFTGRNMLFVDNIWLQNNNIVIDTQYDRILWDGNQYKITREGKFPHYHGVSLYLCERVADTLED